MTDNKGAFPLDPTSPVGQFRALIGDTASKPYDPPETGFQNYDMYSDIEIEVFLALSDNSVEGAIYQAYMQMAGAAARESRSVKDLDLQVDLTKRATDLRLIAAEWRDRWESSTAEIFEVFDLGGSDCGCVPEGVPRQVCRRGCSGNFLF